mgnify:FL=1
MFPFKLIPYSFPSNLFTSTTKLALESDGIEAFVMPDCAESVLTQEADDPVDLMLPDPPPPLFSKSPVLRCFFNFSPCSHSIYSREKRIAESKLTISNPFLIFPEPRDRLLAVGSAEFILRTKPPLESSTRLSRFSAASGFAPVLPSLLRRDVNDALNVLLALYLDALPNGALFLTP